MRPCYVPVMFVTDLLILSFAESKTERRKLTPSCVKVLQALSSPAVSEGDENQAAEVS